MQEQKNKKLKNTTILLLGLSMTGCLAFFYYYNQKTQETEKKLQFEKSILIANLTKSKDSISIVIAENSLIKNDLLVEQQKISNLIDELNNSKSTIEELNKYKIEVVKLRKQVAILKQDKLDLSQKYEALKSKQDSTVYVLKNTVELRDKLEESNFELSNMVKKTSKVTFAELKAETLLKSKSGSASKTINSNNANYVKLDFMVIGNSNTNPVEKNYYVQIINPKNNVIGKRLSKKFGPMILDYSYASTFKYVDQNLMVSSGIDVANLEKGEYFVNVFDNDKLALKSSFTLK